MSRIGERKVTIGYLGLLYDVRFLYAMGCIKRRVYMIMYCTGLYTTFVEDESSNGLMTSVTGLWMFIECALSLGLSFLFLLIGVDTHPLLDGVFC